MTLNHHSGSTFNNFRNPDLIPAEQVFGKILLQYNQFKGISNYYHAYSIYYKGIYVGELYAGQRTKKHEVQLDINKQIFYSYSRSYWYEVFNAILDELRVSYNNIRYVEIAIDTDKNILEQFRYLFNNAENNMMNSNAHYRMKKNVNVHTMNNGSSFLIDGEDNTIAIYNKSDHAEKFIVNYFQNNGFERGNVYRVECRLTWNYLRYLRNKKQLNIVPETFLNQQKLATLFQIATKEKIRFKELHSKYFTGNRNPAYKDISIIDDLPLEYVEIGITNPELHQNHYKNNSVDINIIRQNYFQYIDTGKSQYLLNINSSAKAAGIERTGLNIHLRKFTHDYKGSRTHEKESRMNKALKTYSEKSNFLMKIVNQVRILLE